MMYIRQEFRTLKFVSTIILASILSTALNAQSISTVGEIYDYEVNDIFHTKESGSSSSGGFYLFSNIQIIGKYYSTDLDTLFYIRNVHTEYEGSDQWGFSYNSFMDTLSYTNLNSLINDGDIDSLYYGYNGRTVNFNEVFPDSWYFNARYIEGCGGPYKRSHFYSDDGTYDTDYSLSFFYFKKGSEEWGIPRDLTAVEMLHFNRDLKIYPNPASDHLVIDFSDQNYNSVSGTVYTSSGKQIRQLSFSPLEKKRLDISTLDVGLYLIQLNIDDNLYSAKFVKN